MIESNSSFFHSMFPRLWHRGFSSLTPPSPLTLLRHSSLYQSSSFINGSFLPPSSSTSSFPLYNPATNSLITSIPSIAPPLVSSAIEAASTAFRGWKNTPVSKRSEILRKLSELIYRHIDDLSLIMTFESGKPLKESKGEWQYAASFLPQYSEDAIRLFGEYQPSPIPSARVIVNREPLGVVGAITPWNFPAAMITRKIGAALAAGCTVILKPSELTPLSATAIAQLSIEAGLPAGVFNIVLSEKAEEIGDLFTKDKRINKITFTGSTRVGQLLAEKCTKNGLKKFSLELGGNAPFIVFNDADLEKAVDGAIASKLRNAGQACVATNRIYVQRGIETQFIDLLKKKMEILKVGNGLEEGVDIGPLINKGAVEKVKNHINDAITKGGEIILGGGKAGSGNGSFISPSIIYCSPKSSSLSSSSSSLSLSSRLLVEDEETFGPAAFLFPFDSEEEIIDRANNTRYGLAAYVYTRDSSRVWRMAEALQFGMVALNGGSVSAAAHPFGGIKMSGVGREGSHFGVEEYTNLKTTWFYL